MPRQDPGSGKLDKTASSGCGSSWHIDVYDEEDGNNSLSGLVIFPVEFLLSWAAGRLPPQHCTVISMNLPSFGVHDSFRYVTTGAESDQPVGALCYQWVGCRDHAGITCFPHSGSWQAQGGPAYICRDQTKCDFHNMGPLEYDK